MPPRKPLDEASLRREDFVPGTPVQLADGQDWELRRPLVVFVPDDGDAGFKVCLEIDPDDDYQDLLDARDACYEKGGALVADLARAELDLARRILLANYDLTSDQVARLLRFGYDPDENPAGFSLRNEVMDVAMGRGPKPSPDGEDSLPTPSAEDPGKTG